MNRDLLINGGVTFAIACLASVSVNVAQYYLAPIKTPPILVVDTAGIMLAKQAWFTKELTKFDITDAGRVKVLEQTKQFVIDIDHELTIMQQSCNCVIFDKGAVIIGNYVDVTENLKKKLNL